ncbi:MAG: G-D-S-L family lipolytic protein, partial [Rivularia sp. (in: cyanobacteria)]
MQTFVAPSMQLSIVPNSNQPLKIVALGDSLVYGFGDPDG